MAHLIAIALTLAWVAANFYVWHVIRSQEAVWGTSVVLGAIYFVPFWLYVMRIRR